MCKLKYAENVAISKICHNRGKFLTDQIVYVQKY